MFSLFQITIPSHKQLPRKQSSSLSQPQHPRTSISNTKTTELQHKVWKWKQRSQLPDHLWHSHAQTVDNLFHQWGILQYKIWPQNSSESHHLNTEMDEKSNLGIHLENVICELLLGMCVTVSVHRYVFKYKRNVILCSCTAICWSLSKGMHTWLHNQDNHLKVCFMKCYFSPPPAKKRKKVVDTKVINRPLPPKKHTHTQKQTNKKCTSHSHSSILPPQKKEEKRL